MFLEMEFQRKASEGQFHCLWFAEDTDSQPFLFVISFFMSLFAQVSSQHMGCVSAYCLFKGSVLNNIQVLGLSTQHFWQTQVSTSQGLISAIQYEYIDYSFSNREMIFALFSIDKPSTESHIWYIVKVRLATENTFVETKIVITLKS